jgi:glycosyltransferase involved in cell wall biosynthesis
VKGGSRLRIAFIGLRGVPASEGGIERHVEELGARLADRGHEVTVYCRTNYVSERPPTYRGMNLRYVPAIGTKHMDFIAHSAASSVLVLGKRADIVHYHALGSGLVAPLPRYLSRSKIVLTVHGLDYARQKWTGLAKVALKAGERLSACVPHATITVSQALADHYAARLGRKADYIPNGMPVADMRPRGGAAARLGLGDRPYFLFVGRLVPEKAPDLVIKAFSHVPGDMRLVLAGSSGFTDAYAAGLREAAAADPRVIMPGGVYGAELSELFSNAAAFVNASSLEGLPITLLEAIAHRAPVIVSDIAPHLEVVGGDGAGHRVVSQGDVEALAAAMTQTLAAQEEARAGAHVLAQSAASRYSWDAVADATEAVYARVTGRPAEAPASAQRPFLRLPLPLPEGVTAGSSLASPSAGTATAAADGTATAAADGTATAAADGTATAAAEGTATVAISSSPSAEDGLAGIASLRK